jgi:hypothetical protein
VGRGPGLCLGRIGHLARLPGLALLAVLSEIQELAIELPRRRT